MRRALLAALVLGALIPAHGASAAFPGDNGKLVYSLYNSAATAWGTCTRNPDGTGEHCFGSQGPARWPPDGNRLVFARNDGNIYTANPDGTDTPGDNSLLAVQGVFIP